MPKLEKNTLSSPKKEKQKSSSGWPEALLGCQPACFCYRFLPRYDMLYGIRDEALNGFLALCYKANTLISYLDHINLDKIIQITCYNLF